MDLTGVPREEIDDMIEAAQRELALRQTVDVYREQLAQFQANYRDAIGRVELPEYTTWEKPEYALDAYALGDTVTHSGGFYRSLLPCNLLDPKEAGWRQVNKDGSPRGWVEPVREHDAYRTGEVVVYGGKTYECVGSCVMAPPHPDSEFWKIVDASDE